MSDREKELCRRIAALPEDLQQKFLEQARGAALALETLDKPEKRKEGAPCERA